MTHRDFCYWLQGFFELSQFEELSQSEVKLIKEHLTLVLNLPIILDGGC